jgi:hypothetical protein
MKNTILFTSSNSKKNPKEFFVGEICKLTLKCFGQCKMTFKNKTGGIKTYFNATVIKEFWCYTRMQNLGKTYTSMMR